MDFFTMPDRSEENFLYAYIVLILVFLFASFTVNRLKKANKKTENKEEIKAYEMEVPTQGENKNN